MRARFSCDLASGLFFIAFGAGALALSMEFAMGTTVRMGPAYFPTLLGSMLVVIGVWVAGRALFARSEPMAPLYVRPMLVLLAVLAFAGLLVPAGLILANTAMIVLACAAGRSIRMLEMVKLLVVLNLLAWSVFVYGLHLPIPLWPA
jgi:hypothetical protein